jgi:DNA polymerase/3'-5' exonuclease PolX
MAEKNKRPYSETYPLACEVLEILKPFTERIVISGSLRRCKEMIGDLEIVTIPKYENRIISENMFGEQEIAKIDLLSEFIMNNSRFEKRKNKNGYDIAYGHFNKCLVYHGKDYSFPLDVFSADERTWVSVNFVRTGSSQSNVRVFTAFLRKKMESKCLMVV